MTKLVPENYIAAVAHDKVLQTEENLNILYGVYYMVHILFKSP